jgi:toxin ParE1/3/4
MKIIWTGFAMDCVKTIYDYQLETEGRKRANRIKRGIISEPKVLIDHPAVGQVEEYLEALNLNHRYLVLGNYKIIYRIENTDIYIADVFDTRQDPEKLVSRNKS